MVIKDIIYVMVPNCLIIYPVGPLYYCPGHPSNTIPTGALMFYIGLKRLHLNLLNIVTLLTLKVVLGDHHTRLTTILSIFNSKLSRSILADTRIFLSQLSMELKKTLSKIINQRFSHVSITRLKRMAGKELLECLPENIPELE